MIVSIPALVIVLVLFALLDQLMLWLGKAGVLPWRRGRDNRPVSATGFEVLHGAFYPGKVEELKQRQVSLLLRDGVESAAPPLCRVDLDSGKAVFRAAPAAPATGGEIENR